MPSFLYGFLPGLRGQSISETYPRRTARSKPGIHVRSGPRDPKQLTAAKYCGLGTKQRQSGVLLESSVIPVSNVTERIWDNIWFYRVVLNFCGSFFLQISDLFILRELIFAIVKDWFFLLGINFCDFQEVAFHAIEK